MFFFFGVDGDSVSGGCEKAERKIPDLPPSPSFSMIPGKAFPEQILQKLYHYCNWVVVSKIFHFHPYLEKSSNLTNIFQMG